MLYISRIFGPIASAFNKTNRRSYNKAFLSLDLNSIKKEPAVYKITNINVNSPDFGKVYIGTSVNPRNRVIQHFSTSPSSKITSINSAIRNLGGDNFKFEILEYIGTRDKITIRDRENYYLNLYTNKYNVTNLAYSNAGNVKSDSAIFNMHIRKSFNSANFLFKGSGDHTHALVATDITNNQKFFYVSFNKAAKAFDTSVKSIATYNNCIKLFNLVPYLIEIPNYHISPVLQPITIITIVPIADPNTSFSFNSYSNAALFLGCTVYKLKYSILKHSTITASSLYSNLTFEISVKHNTKLTP